MYTLISPPELPVTPVAHPPGSPHAARKAYRSARMAATAGLNLQAAIATAEATRLAHATDTPDNREARIFAARTLQRAIVNIEARLTGPAYQSSIPLRNLLNRARDEVRTELETEGAIVAPPPTTALTELLARLPSTQLHALESALMLETPGAGLQTALLNIYPLPLTPGIATDWRSFCSNFTISNLGGKNIRNFLVRPNTAAAAAGAVAEVLKLEWRFGLPRLMDEIAHEIPAITAHLAPTYGPIMVPSEDRDGNPCGRTLMVTELLVNGNFKQFAAKTNPLVINASLGTPYGEAVRPPRAHVRRVLDLCQQMGRALADMEANQLFFPDAKGTNWLVEGAGHLRIADTKSFIRTNGANQYLPTLPENANTDIMSTPGFLSNTLKNLPILSDINPIHSAILGRNIYLALTDVWPPRAPTDDNQIELSTAIDHWPHFMELTNLIWELTDLDPAKQPRAAEATTCLEQIALFDSQLAQLATLTRMDHSALIPASIQEQLDTGHTIIQAVAYVGRVLNETIMEATNGNGIRARLVANTPILGGEPLFSEALFEMDLHNILTNTGDLFDVLVALKVYTATLRAAETNLPALTGIEASLRSCRLERFGISDTAILAYLHKVANTGAIVDDRVTSGITAIADIARTHNSLDLLGQKITQLDQALEEKPTEQIINEHTAIIMSINGFIGGTAVDQVHTVIDRAITAVQMIIVQERTLVETSLFRNIESIMRTERAAIINSATNLNTLVNELELHQRWLDILAAATAQLTVLMQTKEHLLEPCSTAVMQTLTTSIAEQTSRVTRLIGINAALIFLNAPTLNNKLARLNNLTNSDNSLQLIQKLILAAHQVTVHQGDTKILTAQIEEELDGNIAAITTYSTPCTIRNPESRVPPYSILIRIPELSLNTADSDAAQITSYKFQTNIKGAQIDEDPNEKPTVSTPTTSPCTARKRTPGFFSDWRTAPITSCPPAPDTENATIEQQKGRGEREPKRARKHYQQQA